MWVKEEYQATYRTDRTFGEKGACRIFL